MGCSGDKLVHGVYPSMEDDLETITYEMHVRASVKEVMQVMK